jgi:hypothetical protein
LFPDDFIGRNNLYECESMLGRQDPALAEAREAARLFPSPWSYGQVIYSSILTDRFDDARAALREADGRNFDNETCGTHEVFWRSSKKMSLRWSGNGSGPSARQGRTIGCSTVEGWRRPITAISTLLSVGRATP